MPDPRVVEFNGVRQEFPSDATDAEISAALQAIPAANAPNAPKARTWSNMASVASLAASKAIPAVATAAEELATNPGVPRAIASVGRTVGAVAPIVAGAAEGGPVGGIVGLAASAKGAWAGSKTGWFSGKLLQSVSAPVAEALRKIEPYAQGLSTLSGAQAVDALAQIAEPRRTDIGTLGIGSSDTKASDRAAVMSAQIKALADKGMPQSVASRTVYNAWAKYLNENR